MNVRFEVLQVEAGVTATRDLDTKSCTIKMETADVIRDLHQRSIPYTAVRRTAASLILDKFACIVPESTPHL